MFQIDKAEFGTFVAQLRAEKGLTQKALAELLYVSDKAVSKWERGLSLPDISALMPLSEILGVTVTELLEGRHIENAEEMDAQQVESLLKKAIGMSDEQSKPSREQRRKKRAHIPRGSAGACAGNGAVFSFRARFPSAHGGRGFVNGADALPNGAFVRGVFLVLHASAPAKVL